jgi:ABC-type branched-subunit amino acid transport system ATPase component
MTSSFFSVRNVSVRFGGLVAVDGASIDIVEREITCLIGANGAGKTTLLNVISGFQRASAGMVSWRGSDVSRRGASYFAKAGIVRTFQDLRLFPSLSVAENVYAGVLGVRPVGALGAVHRRALHERTLKHAVAALDHVGLRDVAGERAADLSYGEQKMLALARALAGSPELLLLDEPLSGLSNDLINTTIEIVAEYQRAGGTVVIVDHNMEGVMNLAERVVVLERGAVLADGTPSEIAANSTVQSAYLGVA